MSSTLTTTTTTSTLLLSPTSTDVPTTLNYLHLDTSEVGGCDHYMYLNRDPPPRKLKSNAGDEPHKALIHNLRGRESFASLDTTGFEYIKHESEEKEFVDEGIIKTKYYKEVEDLLKKLVPGVKRVFIFDHTIRRNYEGLEGIDTIGQRPAEKVHVDQTYGASANRVFMHMGEDAERLSKSRVRIINVWRPIANTVHHYPLACLDYRTLPEEDLIAIKLYYPDREGAIFGVRHNPDHRWYYLREQQPDEVTLLKCYDSKDEGQARLTPHTAFRDRTSPTDAPPRQSIEVRALVFDAE